MKNSPTNKDDAPNKITITRITNPFGRPYMNKSVTTTTTVFATSPSSFSQIVQFLTGPSKLNNFTHQPAPSPRYSLPPLITVPTKRQYSSSTIFERCNRPKINPVRSGVTENIPSLLLTSPDSPLASKSGDNDPDVEEREIREKGFYLYSLPPSTPTDPKPQLLILFPLTSPRAADSLAAST